MAKDKGQDGHDGRLTAKDIEAFVKGGENGLQQRHRVQESGPERGAAAQETEATDLHVCMGLNACVGHGAKGSGMMAGMGECATVTHVCHGANECRGQGGCGYSGHDAEQAIPGAQHCRYSGSCASPINESRVHAAGPFRGTSVWKRARKVFEQRMYEAGVPFGPSPGAGIPDDLVPPYERPRPHGTPQ
ncbi:hypothetical protein [Actinomadura oligospora]|uniref:hypothetical protein n=1 Tax=Actinomadura oligospora TaxID=111804 RepID=UPI0004B8E090|nr:hypothetical protein [Actinomadura oligospora]